MSQHFLEHLMNVPGLCFSFQCVKSVCESVTTQKGNNHMHGGRGTGSGRVPDM